MNLPKWVKILGIALLVIIVCVILKVNLSGNVRSNGIGGNLTRGLVK